MLESVTRGLRNKSVIGAVALAMIGLGSAAKADVELTFFYPVAVGGPVTKVVDGYAETYSEMTPGVTVTPVYTGSYLDTVTKTITAVKGGNPPDIAVILAVDTFTLYDEDAILAYDDLISAEEEQAWLDSFYPAFMENGRVEGKVWGIPFQRSTPVLYWNKDAFTEA
ncbi:MAG: extracellular solute-binding protein, partial [Pseudomonadota bacterium]